MQLLGLRARRAVIALTSAVGVLLVTGSAVSAAPGGPPDTGRPAGVVVTAQERDCVELVVQRTAKLAEVRAVVPQRYDLVPIGSDATRMFLVFTQCTVSVEGHLERRTAAMYVIAQLVSRDGVPGGVYLLEHWVDNAELAARYRAAGLPTEFVPSLSATETIDEARALAVLTWASDEPGKAFTVSAEAPHPLDVPEEQSTARYFHDGPRGDVLLTFGNAVQTAVGDGRALVTADFRQASEIVPLFYSEAFLQLRGLTRFAYFRGGWSSTVERL